MREHRGADGSADELLITGNMGGGGGGEGVDIQSFSPTFMQYCGHLYTAFIERRKEQCLPVPVELSELSLEVFRVTQGDLLLLAVATVGLRNKFGFGGPVEEKTAW